MSRAGRKRRATARRYPSGKIKPVKEKPPVLPHRVGFSPMEMKASTVHGRYALRGVITEQQHRAGELYLIHRNRYRAAMMSPDTLRNAGTNVQPNVDDAAVIVSFNAVLAALKRLVVDVEWVVFLDGTALDLNRYRTGLDRLVEHYRL